MTTIKIVKSNNGTYKRLTCEGHAGYARVGNDIVCASVSCLVINTLNSLEVLTHAEIEIMSDERRGFIDCLFLKDLSTESILLIDSMILGLQGIVADYGKKYLEIRFEEV